MNLLILISLTKQTIEIITNLYTSCEEHYTKGNKKKAYEFLIIPELKLKKFNVVVYNNKDKKEYDFGKLKTLIN